ncbi:RNA-directed DNA polymerase, eukaryota, reverse transcriptase zinc-binding domain protein [Tanacetum coccineum]
MKNLESENDCSNSFEVPDTVFENEGGSKKDSSVDPFGLYPLLNKKTNDQKHKESGLAQKAKKDWAKELCVKNKVNFLAIQETKMEEIDLFSVRSGGMVGVWLLNGIDLMIIAVYAPHDPRDKRMLWDYLAHVINQWQGEVVIMGDFNEVRVKSDRKFPPISSCLHFRDGLRESVSHLPILTDSIILILVLSSLAEVRLRQGVPLSPFLFILAMERLHTITCKAMEIGNFKDVSSSNGNMSISHLIYADDVIFIGVCVPEEDVSDMANAIGYGAAKLPLKYLGVPIGWGESGEKKMMWVRWKKCLASKKSRGLGIGSIFVLNISLLFKWIWRFLSQPSDLWVKVIKIIYELNGGIFDGSVPGSSKSTWGAILSSIKHLKQKGIDLLSLCIQKLGNGVSTWFWEDTWCGDQSLKAQFPRIYLLDTDRGCNIANRLSLPDWSTALRRQPRGGAESCQFSMLQSVIRDVILSDEQDSWQWSLDDSVGFSVSSVRSLIDAHILDVSSTATRWNPCIPIKVNVFLWRLLLNKLPSRVNLDRKDIDVVLILCLICQLDVKTANHIFFTCEIAKELWALMARWWELDIPFCVNISEWFDWLDSLHLSNKAWLFLDGVGGMLLWSIWSFRNRLVFSNPSLTKAEL